MDDYPDEPLDRSADDSQACLILLQAAGIAMRGAYDAADGDRRIETFDVAATKALAHWSQKFDPATHTAKSGGEAR